MNLHAQCQQQLLQDFPQGKALLLGLSGGLDSMVLLHLLAKVCRENNAFSLRAIHIHHGLSPNADAWLAHCAKECANLGVPFRAEKVTLDKNGNIEAKARQARYQAVAKQMSAQEIFVTAHHQDDQVETFFLALKRGSGLKGLSAMARFSTLNGVNIYRPLLNFGRASLENYARAENLSWVNDESNEDLHYERNFLRHGVLPILHSRWTHFAQAVCRSAQLCAEQEELISELLQEKFQHLIKPSGQLNLKDFAHYSPAQQNALLRLWFKKLAQPMPSQKQLHQLKQDVIFAKPDRKPQFQLAQKILRRYQDDLYLTPIYQDVSQFQKNLKVGQKLILPDNLGEVLLQEEGEMWHFFWQGEQGFVQKTTLKQKVLPTLGFHYQGKILLPNGQHESLKKYWQKLQVPPWQRKRIPLIFIKGELYSVLVNDKSSPIR